MWTAHLSFRKKIVCVLLHPQLATINSYYFNTLQHSTNISKNPSDKKQKTKQKTKQNKKNKTVISSIQLCKFIQLITRKEKTHVQLNAPVLRFSHCFLFRSCHAKQKTLSAERGCSVAHNVPWQPCPQQCWSLITFKVPSNLNQSVILYSDSGESNKSLRGRQRLYLERMRQVLCFTPPKEFLVFIKIGRLLWLKTTAGNVQWNYDCERMASNFSLPWSAVSEFYWRPQRGCWVCQKLESSFIQVSKA